MQISPLLFITAIIPIFLVLILMIVFRWGGARAGSAGWVSALIISTLFFGTDLEILVHSQAKGLMLSLYVLYIVWMGLILYTIAQESGAISQIGRDLTKVTENKTLQLLTLAWVFSSFLQGIAGYGVPIAVVSPLLIALGFTPVLSVTAVAIGHAWSVNFGSIAASFNAMIAVSGLDGRDLAPWSGILLGITCFLTAVSVVIVYDKGKSILKVLPAIISIGTVMSLTQYLLANNGMWNIAAFGAGALGLLATAIVSRLPIYRTPKSLNNQGQKMEQEKDKQQLSSITAFFPYIILIIIVITAELVPVVHGFLNQVKVNLTFPETETGLGWINPAGKSQSISIFGHSGALALYASAISYFFFRKKNLLKDKSYKTILSKTTSTGLQSSLGIVSMVGMAMIMEQSGMTNTIATGLGQFTGKAFPFISPFIGVLGSFMTGSNTNSNVVFVPLQKQIAELLKLSVPLILAAQTTGGSIGGMLAPARIIVGCSTAGLTGQEGQVLGTTIKVGLIITTIIGLITFLFAFLLKNVS